MVCGCFRAGRRVSTLTHGRMLTTASIRLLTASASCSKLLDLKLWQLPCGGLNSLIFPTLWWRLILVLNLYYSLNVSLSNTCCVLYFFLSAPVRKSCQHPVRLKRRYHLLTCIASPDFDVIHLLPFTNTVDHMYVCLSSPSKSIRR